ncbi:MAG: hypothetical protein LAT75_09465 [Candidatus Cyclonatronum sp.]|uniref:THUMP-like domain-containing protein n=1 Tax=Cyclonatronum sp. TaxID=3024185 RepID=UPI0025BC0B11|nr:hypothetical protein [Cyclonatronum sp.]MCH8487085.1 hypothetical protein [Cyclonatronum sp.]
MNPDETRTEHPLSRHPEWTSVLDEAPLPDPAEFAIRGRSAWGDLTPAIAEQLFCYRKAEKKLAGFHQRGWLYRRLSLEQCSGTAAAAYKAGLFSGRLCVDLTGGLGIDSLAFADRFEQVHHVESVPEISALARHNHRISGRGHITHYTQTAEDYLHAFRGQADLIYADPSRRDEQGRVFRLADCLPDIPALLPVLREKARNVLIKLSPLYDLVQLLRELPDTEFVQVVSLRGEVKEILAGWGTEQKPEPAKAAAVSAVLLDDDGKVRHQFRKAMPGTVIPEVSGDALRAGDLLLLPDPAVGKAGATETVAQQLGLKRLSPATDLLSADAGFVPEAFPGRAFRLLELLPFHNKKLKKELAARKLQRVHVYRRGFPLEVSALRSRLNLSMGDEGHLIFFTDRDHQKWCASCRLL